MANGIVLNIDTTKSEFQNPMIELRQGDGNYQSLTVTVTSNGEPFDLTGWTITFMGTTAGGYKIVDTAVSNLDNLNGKFTYTPTKAWGQNQGEFKNAYFSFVKSDKTASSAEFRVNVLDAVDITAEEANDYISIVDQTIDKLTSDISSLVTNVNDLKAQNNNIKTSDNIWTGKNTFNSPIVGSVTGSASKLQTPRMINGTPFDGTSDITITGSGALAVGGVYPTLDDLITANPDQGRTYITTDNGNWNYWNGTTWVAGGVYQAVGFTDRSVKYETVDYINFDNINDNYANDSKIKGWSSPQQYNVTNHVITFKGASTLNSGIMVPVTMRNDLQDDETLYLNFDYATDRSGGTDFSSVYLMDESENFLNGKTTNLAVLTETSVSTHIQIKLKNSMYGINIPQKFYILFSSQTDYTLTISELILNKTNYISDFKTELVELNTDKFKNHPVNLTKFNKWNNWDGDKAFNLSDGTLLFRRASTSGNGGVSFDIEADVSEDLFVTTNIVGSNYSIWLLDTTDQLISNLSTDRTFKRYGDITIFKLTREQLKSYSLTNNTLRILVSVQGQNNVVIKEIAVSNQAGVGQNKNSMNRLVENDGYRKQIFIGQQTEKVPTLTSASYAGVMYGGYKRTSSFDGVLKEITAYVPSDGSYKFTVANLDQYGLIVNKTDFTLNLVTGLNRLDVETRNISIKANQLLLMDLSTAGVFTPDTNGIFEPTILQDSNHTVNQDGHGGNQLFDSDKIVPFSYCIIDRTTTSKVNDISSEVDELSGDVLELMPLKNRIIISAPNGIKYKLVVDNSGILSTVSAVPNKVLIIGNSLTWEKGGIGMAASDGNHDYYQLVKDYILSANPNATVTPRTSFSSWEMAVNTADRDVLFNNQIKPLLSSDTDMVIIQLGDNINSSERHATFANDADKLIKNIKAISPNATIIWVGAWFISFSTLIDEIKTATTNNGALFADITPFRTDIENKSYVGATRTGLDNVSWTVTSQGEADHPGDTGMFKIANSIISNFDF